MGLVGAPPPARLHLVADTPSAPYITGHTHQHPIVGEMTLNYETLTLPSSSGIVIATYLAEPGTPSADALDLLRSWTAQPIQAASRATTTS